MSLSRFESDARAIMANAEGYATHRDHVKALYLRRLIAWAIEEDEIAALLVIADAMDISWDSVVEHGNHGTLIACARASLAFQTNLVGFCACVRSPAANALAGELSDM